MRIPDSTLSEIRDRVDIAEVIGEHVALQRRGSRYWGLCPFHQEKTPSFSVTPERGVFYCFGCHKGGTVFDFVMETEKVPWRDAVQMLAKKAGVELPQEESEPDGLPRETFLELHRRVAGSFHWLLTESPQAEAARRYLEGRGVSRESIDAFQLGYAPPDRHWLHRFLIQKGYSPEFLGRTGLFVEGGRGEGGREAGTALFGNRLMFPIANARGEVLAFGGRVLGSGQPKYLNSPETAFFRKGEHLFGMDRAAQAIRTAGCFVLVEGYMDVIAMHQAGFPLAVAPLGTSLTDRQARLLKRYAPRGVLLFDGDDAGRKAAARAVEVLEHQDLIAQVATIPQDQDPADLAHAGQADVLKRLIEQAKDSFAYLLERALGENDRSRVEGRERIRDTLFPYVAAPGSQMRRDGYIAMLAAALDADRDAVQRDFDAWLARGRQRERPASATGAQVGAPAGAASRGEARPGQPGGGISEELFLLLAVAANRGLFPQVRNAGITLSDLEDERARTLFVALEEAYRVEETGFDALCARMEDPGLRELAIRKVSSGEFDMNQEQLVADAIRRIRRRALDRKRDTLGAEMRRAEREKPDPARMRELQAEKIHLDSEIQRLAKSPN